MRRRDVRHGNGRFLRWFPVVLVLVVLAAAGASYRFELGPRWFGLEAADPSADPAAVAPPEGLTLPELSAPTPVAAAVTDPAPGSVSATKVRRALLTTLGDPNLGSDVFASVSALGADAPLFQRGDGVAVPASTTKLLTTTAALAVLGPDHTFRTSVVASGGSRIVLVGGGDPFLASRPDPEAYPHRADVVTLARATAAALDGQGISKVRLGYDDSLFSGPRISPHWPADYVPDGVVSPISALWVDEGRPPSGPGRVDDPSMSAATVFAAALTRAGVRVLGAPQPRRAGSEASPLADVESAPLADIVEQTLSVSDNEAAEVLAHQVGLASSGRGTFAGGAAGVIGALDDLGVRTQGAELYDGSGLSRDDRLAPRTLTDVLQVAAAAAHPELRSVVTGLPVAGFSGSLSDRFADSAPQGRGRVRAKTGTLSGVSALAGVVTDLDSNPMVFVLMADRVALADTLDARDALDALAAALGACHCGR